MVLQNTLHQQGCLRKGKEIWQIGLTGFHINTLFFSIFDLTALGRSPPVKGEAHRKPSFGLPTFPGLSRAVRPRRMLPPVARLLLQNLVLQPPPLPLGMIGVLEGKFG